MPTNPHFADPATLMRVRNLDLRARTVVDGFWQGLHRSPFRGFSNEFAEYRSYTPGDDSRTIDWKVLARTDRTYIRTYEEETGLACHLILDRSRSMDFTSLEHTKLEYARTLAASLALFLEKQGDSTGLLTFSKTLHEAIPPGRGNTHLHHIFAALGKPAEPGGTAPDKAIDRLVRSVRRRGLVILISDFLTPLEEITARFRTLAACGHDVSIFQILDPAEIDFSFKTSGVFEDLETGKKITLRPELARKEYLQRFHAHNEAVKDAAKKTNIIHHTFRTDEPLEKALFAHLADRARQVRTPRRSAARTS